MRLKHALLFFCLAIGIVPLAVTGLVSVREASDVLSEQAFSDLAAARDSRAAALASAVDAFMREAAIMSRVKEVYNAVPMTRDFFMGAKPGRPVPVGTAEYKDMHDYLAPAFAPFTEVLGFKDALLVADDGRVLFGFGQGREVGEDVKAGPLAGTSLAAAWRQAMAGRTVFVDFAPYPPLGGEPVAFVAAPVKNHTGTMIEAAAILRVPREPLAAIMEGGGEKGPAREYMLVGSDGGIRLASGGQAAVAGQAIPAALGKHPAVARGLAGETGRLLESDGNGTQHLVAFAPVRLGQTAYALIARAPAAAAFAAATGLRRVTLIVAGLTVLAVFLAVAVFVRRAVARPLSRLLAYLTAVTGGDFTAPPPRLRGELEDVRLGVTAMVAEIRNKLGFSASILKAVTLPCLVVDTEDRVLFANGPLAALLGKRDGGDGLVGKDVAAIFGSGSAVTGLLGACLADRTPRLGAEELLDDGAGQVRHVRLDTAPLYDLDEVCIGAFALVVDLTASKAREALLASRNGTLLRVAGQAEAIARHVADRAGALSGRVAAVSDGAMSQTAKLQETAGAIEHLNTSLDAVATGAEGAAGGAEAAMAEARAGHEAGHHTAKAIARVRVLSDSLRRSMDALGSRAASIGGIVAVIADIADQTNLLALNAAIEAARAGEAGRGFAVVADEVRKLAEKTMTATREVSKTVHAVLEAVEESAGKAVEATAAVGEVDGLVARSGESLAVIVSRCEDAAGAVRAIASSAKTQASVHDAISRAVTAIGEVAGETSQGMDTAAAAVADLAGQAGELMRLIEEMREDSAA